MVIQYALWCTCVCVCVCVCVCTRAVCVLCVCLFCARCTHAHSHHGAYRAVSKHLTIHAAQTSVYHLAVTVVIQVAQYFKLHSRATSFAIHFWTARPGWCGLRLSLCAVVVGRLWAWTTFERYPGIFGSAVWAQALRGRARTGVEHTAITGWLSWQSAHRC